MGLPVELLECSENFKHQSEGVFPDNVQAVELFSDMLTQWRVGSGGAIGFDYNVIPILFRIRKTDEEEQEEAFSGLQVMERAALKAMREKG